jgi:hypothetical protein
MKGNSMFKKLIEWTESEASRARKIVLFSVVFSFLFVSVAILIMMVYKIPVDSYIGYYGIFAGIAGTAIGFYTGTDAKLDDPKIAPAHTPIVKEK